MSDYGVQPTGFVRKPLAAILSDIEQSMITEFGPGVIQTSQSPLGQINGLFADLAYEVWENAEDIYQSYDPDQAEGARLDMLARIRLMFRGDDTDEQFRAAITNEGQARVDLQDLSRAIGGLDGVTYHNVDINETGEISQPLAPATIAVTVIGGNEIEIGEVMRQYIVPGINTFGNTSINVEIDGYCRTFNIIRPIDIPVTVELNLRLGTDKFGCPPPSTTAIIATLAEEWLDVRANDLDVSHFIIRGIIECKYPMVEVYSMVASRDGLIQPANTPVVIGFTEIASITADNITVVL